MTGGFDVSSHALTAKSGEIAAVSASVRECVQASDEMGVGGLVYGILFDPTMLPVLSQAKNVLAELIGDVADAAEQISTTLKRNAETYESVETFLEQSLTEMFGEAAQGGSGG